jgi:hypothetical protein
MATSFNDQDEFSLLPGSPPTSPPDDHSGDTDETDGQISDIPKLRSIHVTAGYREGISSSKNEKIQQGFDEGYALGAEIGYQVGWILGVLEGTKAGQLLKRAQEELDVKNLFSPQYFQEDGLWRWHIDVDENHNASRASGGSGSEETILFRHVAVSHPLVRKWIAVIKDLVGKDMIALKEFWSHDEP